jgi:hypothetical protein
MDSIREDYQKNYINTLAKLGEVELIIKLHSSMKEDLLVEAEKMRGVLAAYNGKEVPEEEE